MNKCDCPSTNCCCASEGAEPIPFITREAVKQALLDGPKLSRDVLVNDETTKSSTLASLELMTLPVCLQFARTLGARSVAGRRLIAAEKNNSATKTRRQSRAVVVESWSRRSRSISDASASTLAAVADNDEDGDVIGEIESHQLQAAARSRRLESSCI